MTSYDVRIYAIETRKRQTTRYRVRWTVAVKRFWRARRRAPRASVQGGSHRWATGVHQLSCAPALIFPRLSEATRRMA